MGGKLGQYKPNNVTYVPGQIGAYVNSGLLTGTESDYQSVIIPSLDHLNISDPKIPDKKPDSRNSRFLGFEGEDIMSAEVMTVKIFDTDLLNDTRINEHIRYDSDRLNAFDYCKNYSATGDKQFGLYYRHGKWDYMDYLPDAQVSASSINPKDIEEIIKNEQKVKQVFIDRLSLCVPNDRDWVRYQLQEKYGYNIAKDILASSDGYYYRLSSYSFNQNTGDFSITLTSYKTVTYNGVDVYDSEIHKYLGNTGIISDNVVTKTVTIPGIESGMYYDVHYRTDIDEVKFWIHKLSENDYPQLNNAINTLTDFEMFPIVCIRVYYKFIDLYPDSEKRVEQTKALLNHIGIDFDNLVDQISQNGNIQEVKDVFFGMGVCPNNRSWAVSAALYESLNWLFILLPPTTNGGSSATKYGISFSEHPFNSTVFFKYRKSEYVDGARYYVDWKDYYLWESEYSHSVSEVNVRIKIWHDVQIAKIHDVEASGQVSSSYRLLVGGGKIYYEYIYSDEPNKSYWEYGGLIEDGTCFCDTFTGTDNPNCTQRCEKYGQFAVDMTNNTGFWSMNSIPITRVLWEVREETTHILKVVHQIHRDRYHYIEVSDVFQTYIIQDGGETSVKNIYPNDDKFVFPLSVEVEEKLTLMEKTNLLGESCYLFFYAVKWEHLEWYETPAFGSFLGFLGFVITAVVTVVSMGSMSFASMTTLQILTKVLTAVIIPVALNFALKLIDQFIGDPLLKAIFSTGAMVASFLAGSYFGNGLGFGGELDLGSAVKMAQIPVKAFNIYNGAVLDEEISSLSAQQSSFTSAYGARMDEFSALLQGFGSGIDTGFLAGLAKDTANKLSSMLIQPEDYYELAFANDVPSMCSRETFCQLTVDDYIKNSLRLE